jgi:hypothetical protein
MAVTHTHPWSTPSARTTGLAAAAVAAAGTTTGDAITPGGDTHADITLTYTYAVAPTAGAAIQVRIMESDATNYDSVTGRLVDQVPAVADTTARYRTFTQVPIGPNLFKLMVSNGDAARELTATVTCRTYKIATDAV